MLYTYAAGETFDTWIAYGGGFRFIEKKWVAAIEGETGNGSPEDAEDVVNEKPFSINGISYFSEIKETATLSSEVVETIICHLSFLPLFSTV